MYNIYTKVRYTISYNRQHWVPALEYQIRDKVSIYASDVHTTHPSWKLAHCYLGPFTVTWQVSWNAYHLWILASMSQLHPIFNVVKLLQAPEDFIPGWKAHPPLPLEMVNGEEYYIVEQILDSQLTRGQLQFLVKWKGYEENSWVLDPDIAAPDKVWEFYNAHPGTPQQIHSAAFHPPFFSFHLYPLRVLM